MEIKFDSFIDALLELIEYCDEQADIYGSIGLMDAGASAAATLAKMTNPFGWAVIFGVGAVSGYLYLRWDSWRDRLFEFLKLMRALNRSYPNPDEQTY